MQLEDLENRLKMIEKAMQQSVANYNLLEGNKQECLFWIKKLKDEVSETCEAIIE